MAWYVDRKRVKKVGKEEAWDRVYSAGDAVSLSGIYHCVACKREIAANKTDSFPPPTHHQHDGLGEAIRWKLLVMANTAGS